MLRTFSFFVLFWLCQVLLLPLLLYVLVLQALERDASARQFAGRVASVWARFLMRLAGARVQLRGELLVPAEQPVLFVSNHQGAFDIPLILSCVPRPVGFMAKRELSRVPCMGAWMNAMGCVFVDRGNRKRAMKSLDEAVRALQNGDSLVVFPEGTRSNGEEMKPFKAGFARIAQRAGVPIVPLVMKGTHRLKRGDHPWITAADVEVSIEKPISVEQLQQLNVHEVARLVQDFIQRRLDTESGTAPHLLTSSESRA